MRIALGLVAALALTVPVPAVPDVARRDLTAPDARQLPASAADLAARIQAHYSTVRDFTADFTLTTSNSLLPTPTVERGQVKVKKPGRMRWTYQTPDQRQFVADGLMLYSFFPKDKYVIRSPIPAGDQASTALLFLTGRGDLPRDFTPATTGEQPPGEWRVLLTPKKKQADFNTLTIEVDRATLALRGLVIVDDQDSISKFRFTRLRENAGLSDKEFSFTIPPGVEIR